MSTGLFTYLVGIVVGMALATLALIGKDRI